mgnify:CR=1 FL=1
MISRISRIIWYNSSRNINDALVGGRYLSSSSKVPVILLEKDLEEKFVRGSGPGGQSVNMRSSKVQLLHKPTGLVVHSHDQRDLHRNRKIARKLLKEKIDLQLNGDQSTIGRRVARKKKRKAKRSQRAREKYGVKAPASGTDE